MQSKFTMESILEITKNRKPDFNNILKVFRCEKPNRPTLFEFYFNEPLEKRSIAWRNIGKDADDVVIRNIYAFRDFGYDYVNLDLDCMDLKADESQAKLKTISANTGFVITDRESFEKYEWDTPLENYYGRVEKYEKYLPDGMKFMVSGPGGILENVMKLVGYDNLCYLLADDYDLVKEIFDKVGQAFYDYYSIAVKYDSVGFIMSNDDWGFNMQTMLSPDTFRELLFPWHKKLCQLVHGSGKPIVLHSCGNLTTVWDDIINDMQYDGKHSYEDKICPVEEMYDKLKGKIAVLGGIDIDFVARKTPQEVYDRCRAMVEKTGCEGYALGTGNSIPDYIPDENFYAMLGAALYE